MVAAAALLAAACRSGSAGGRGDGVAAGSGEDDGRGGATGAAAAATGGGEDGAAGDRPGAGAAGTSATAAGDAGQPVTDAASASAGGSASTGGGASASASASAGGGAPSGKPAGQNKATGPSAAPAIVLSWGGGNRFGGTLFTIDASGDARFEARDAGGKVTRSGPVRLSAAEMSSLEKVLARNKVCSLTSTPGYRPVPEETQTTLSVALGGMNCVVALYANEWSSQAQAAPIEKAIQALSLRAQRARR